MRKAICALLATVLLLVAGGCKSRPGELTIDQRVELKLKEMTIEEKIAQMLVVYYTGDTVDDNLLNVLKTVKPGGFIMMSDNISSYSKTKDFVSQLQSNSEIPMIISIDQEGGLVQRMSGLNDPSATNIPDMLSLGKTDDAELAYSVGKAMAEEMRTIGINVDFAPTVDVLSENGLGFIGTRSFGSSADIVSKMALSLSKGMEENGVIPVYKHFPGHGDTESDSHTELPIIDKTLEELHEKELVPFKAAIENGAQMIMVGHIALPKVSGDNTPASLSKAIITDLLKGDLGYSGLVITDALNMGALTNTYTYEEIYIKAIEAGCDLLLMPNGSKKAVEIIRNNVSEERINESVRKILRFKYKNIENYELLDKTYLGSAEHKNIIDKICKGD